MNAITQEINLNLIPGAIPPRISVSQYDDASRTLGFRLYNGAVSFAPGSGTTAQIRGTKPDNKGFEYVANLSGSTVTAQLTEQMTAVAGDVRCEIVLKDSTKTIGTGNFILAVERAALGEDTDISETVIPGIIDAAEANAERAEAAAALAEEASLHAPYIGANEDWYVWDTVSEQYVDSGVDARGDDGEDGTSIANITKTGSSGLVDTYTVTLTDGTTYTFTVTNGQNGADGQDGQDGADGEDGVGIADIEKTSTVGLVDTYTITLTDGTTYTFTVTNGTSGVPGGGTAGQALIKNSSADSDASWHDVDIPAATASTAGKVKPDGTTTTVDQNGVISAAQTPVATTSAAGKVKPDGTTITIDQDGTIHGADSTPIATVSVAGKVKPDGTTITIDQDGTIHAASSGGVPVGDVSGAAISVTNEVATLTWSDPSDVVIDGTTIAAWAGTKLVRKVGSAPTSPTDGTLIVDSTTRNQYSLTGIQDNTIEYGNTYYYRFFPYTTRNVVTDGSSVTATPTRTIIPLPYQSGTVVYDGTVQTATFADYDPDKETVTGNQGLYAGNWMATFTPKHDYMWSDGTTTGKNVQWTIQKKPLTVPTVTGSFTYDGTQKSATISSFDPNEITQSGNDTGTNAGTYTVLFDLVDSSNMEWSDHTTAQKSVDWTIAKAAGGATLSSDSVTLDTDHLTASVTISNATGTVSGVSSSDTSIATASLNGSTVTISNVNQANGTATVTVSIDASANYLAATETIDVEASFTQIFGVEWDGTSTTAWSRTDDAVGFVDPNPYYAGMSGTPSSPFDSISPWKDMTIVDDADAGKLVQIPKFYYKWTRNGIKMKLQISMTQEDGFLCSPAHADRGDGSGERDYVYIGRYHCASDYKSKTGTAPLGNKTRAEFRTGIHNLGSKIWQNDYAMRWTVNMLYLVEFADWNSQEKIGYGCGDNSAVGNMGYTDNMGYHTGTTQSSRTTYGLGTQYRNIEGWWDNVLDWVDGIYFNSTSIYGIKNPANFSDSQGGTAIGTRASASGYIKAWTEPSVSGFEYALYPNDTDSNLDGTTYVGDYCGYNSSGVVLYAGGYYNQNQYYGAFYLVGSSAAAYKSAVRGSRLQKLP